MVSRDYHVVITWSFPRCVAVDLCSHCVPYYTMSTRLSQIDFQIGAFFGVFWCFAFSGISRDGTVPTGNRMILEDFPSPPSRPTVGHTKFLGSGGNSPAAGGKKWVFAPSPGLYISYHEPGRRRQTTDKPSKYQRRMAKNSYYSIYWSCTIAGCCCFHSESG